MRGPGVMHVNPKFQPVFRELGIEAANLFDHPLIKPWRTLKDRENCLLETTLVDGQPVKWHIKRFAPTGTTQPIDFELRGHNALKAATIPTADLVAYGSIADGRSFVIFNDLTGFAPLDKMIADGLEFEHVLHPTASLAARLHSAGLHHRDLYLCHFMGLAAGEKIELKLIDSARVKPLPHLLRERWIVKDLAQFRYSALQLEIPKSQLVQWLDQYVLARGLANAKRLTNRIARKCDWIGRHDAALRRRQPRRNISIPTSDP